MTSPVVGSESHEIHDVQQYWPAPSKYLAPSSIDEALDLLAEHQTSARPIAGGTDLILEMARGARTGITTLVDLSRIAELASIEITDGRVRLGAMTTHSDVVGNAEMVAVALPLAQACREVGSPALRNRATIAGNLVTASPANDTISALYALNAEITIRSAKASRTVAIDDFYTGFRSTVLEPGELITSIEFDALTAERRGIFVKLGLRRAQAISVVHLAVVAELAGDGQTVSELSVALGSVGPTIVRFDEATTIAAGRSLADSAPDVAAAAAAFVSPIDDVRSTADYRRQGLEVGLRRALESLAEGTEVATWPNRVPRLVPPGEPTPTGIGSSVTAITQVRTAESIIECVVNGEARSASGAVGKTLLDWLRSDLRLTGTKEGCAEGECGACTIHLDGRAALACLIPAARAEGATITTVEGIAPTNPTATGSATSVTITGGKGGVSSNVADPAESGHVLHPIQAAFEQTGGVQCGFCTPGFIMSSVLLDEEVDSPTRSEIVQGLAGNLCRCTGYYAIIEAIERANR